MSWRWRSLSQDYWIKWTYLLGAFQALVGSPVLLGWDTPWMLYLKVYGIIGWNPMGQVANDRLG